MNKAIDDYEGFKKGLERIKYAGLLASQEKPFEKTETEQFIVDEQEQVSSETGATSSTSATSETADKSENSSKKKKKNLSE